MTTDHDPEREALAEIIYDLCAPVHQVRVAAGGRFSLPTRCAWAQAADVHRAVCHRMADGILAAGFRRHAEKPEGR